MNNLQKVIRAWCALCETESLENVVAMRDVKGTRANDLVRAFMLHKRSEKYAERHGLIGVGVISYANNRLERFLSRSCRFQNLA